MVLKTVKEWIDVLFVGNPIILVLLHLGLRLTKTFIELFNILVRVEQLTIICDFLQVLCNFLIKFLGFHHKYFLYCEKIPVFPDWLKQAIEEVIEFEAQVFPYEHDVVPEFNLVSLKSFRKLIINYTFSSFYVFKRLFSLWLETFRKVKVFQGVKWDHWMQKVSRFKALATDLLLVLETKEYELFIVGFAYALILSGLCCFLRLLQLAYRNAFNASIVLIHFS